MEKVLLEKDSITWGVFVQEVKDVGFLALPMISVTLSQYFLQIISMMMVGHLGKLALSSTAIAISLCAVSGFSPLSTMVFNFVSYGFVHFSLEWWSFELLVFLSGLLPNPQLETSVLSICLSIISTIYTIPEATGSAASARVSNALGAGYPQAARLSVYAAMTLAVSEAILVSSTIFASRRILGYIFSNEQDVVDYVTDMVPLMSISVIMDSLHGTLSGIARGCGWQKLGAYVNLGAYYVFGIPIAIILGFWQLRRGKEYFKEILQ
ncbi:hypothetical protein TSUD_49320 [Trifolium subterraneum]|uniref:Uncharacterized protein n=1 Tax=Trifolium subterraneum TaxID=3900 RepID=A0A2Z6M2R2_TRISU|nr:hypothetical protein TSUD_49320 [Trifolium subterraneum]